MDKETARIMDQLFKATQMAQKTHECFSGMVKETFVDWKTCNCGDCIDVRYFLDKAIKINRGGSK